MECAVVPKNITDRKGEEVTEVYLNTFENKLYFLSLLFKWEGLRKILLL